MTFNIVCIQLSKERGDYGKKRLQKEESIQFRGEGGGTGGGTIIGEIYIFFLHVRGLARNSTIWWPLR